MDTPERRVIGSILLLLGVSSLAIAIYTGQIKLVMELLNGVFRTFA